MVFEINVDKIIDNELKFTSYIFLQFVYQQEHSLFNTYLSLKDTFFTRADIEELIEQEYLVLKDSSLGYRFANFKITPKFISDFIERQPPSKVEGEKVEDWIDQWYDLFPKGVKSGGYFVRSDKKGCLNKMLKFVEKYPEYDKDVILRATADYVNHMRMNGYKFMQIAHYLISKDGNSNLAANCEYVKNRLDDGEITDLNEDVTVDKFTRTLNSN